MNLKKFLTYTSVIEALTGFLLIVLPSRVVSLLFGVEITEGGGIILTMIAGAAIFSLSVVVWLARQNNVSTDIVIMLFIYNLLLTAIPLLGAFSYMFHGVGLWLVILFHIMQSVICAIFLKKNKTIKI